MEYINEIKTMSVSGLMLERALLIANLSNGIREAITDLGLIEVELVRRGAMDRDATYTLL